MSKRGSILGMACGLLGLALCTSNTAFAQYARALDIYGGMGFTTTSYSERAAERSNTVSRSFGFQSFLEPRIYNAIGLPIMIGWEYLGPICLDAGDSTHCDNRNERTTSLLFASVGASIYGPAIPWGRDEDASRGRPFIIAGREWVSRGIGEDGCINCTIEGVRFHGGLFVEPGMELPAGRNMAIGFGYRMYGGSSDLENRLVVRLTSGRRSPR